MFYLQVGVAIERGVISKSEKGVYSMSGFSENGRRKKRDRGFVKKDGDRRRVESV